VQQEGKDTVRLLGSMGNREITFAMGKVSCEWTEKQVMLTNWEFYARKNVSLNQTNGLFLEVSWL
jgi:hypothetical protein